MPETARDGVTCVSCCSPGDKKCTACHSVTYCSLKCQKRDWSRHKRLCMPVMIEETKIKGRGLIASRNFKMGDLIFKERAVATIRSQGKEAGLEILSQLNQMTADERNDFYNLTRGSAAAECSVGSDFERHLNEVLSKFNNNAMFSGAGQETGSMFLCYALINHSCSPNVFMDQTWGKETTGELRALRDIKRGEEINDSYIMLGYRNKKQRQDELRKWGFECECASCSLETDDCLLTNTARLEADIRRGVSRQGDKDWAEIARCQHQVVTNLQLMTFAPLLLPMEAADLVCMAQMGRQQHLVKQGMLLLDDIVEKRKVKLYRKNFHTLKNLLESWKKNLENDLSLSSTELKSFSSFRIDVNLQ